MDFSLILCGEKNFYRTAIIIERSSVFASLFCAYVAKLLELLLEESRALFLDTTHLNGGLQGVTSQ